MTRKPHRLRRFAKWAGVGVCSFCIIAQVTTTFGKVRAYREPLVVAVDNGPKNIAVALGVRTVTINGPTNPLSFNPHGDPDHSVIRDHTLFCIACELNQCPYHHECMQNVKTETVLGALDLKVMNGV